LFWHLGADRKEKAIENIPAGMKLSVSASDPTNCFTMLLIETEGGGTLLTRAGDKTFEYTNMTVLGGLSWGM